MRPADFKRLINVQSASLGISSNTLWRWIRDYRVLDLAIPNGVARNALLFVTKNEEGLVSATDGTLSPAYAAALRKYPVPTRGTHYEQCRDWALEVVTAAGHYVSGSETSGSWQVQTAKAKFSEVFRRARTQGPQRITRQGKESVVMIAEEEYHRLTGRSHQPSGLVEFFRKSPLVGVDLDLERDREPARDVEL